MKKYFHFLKKVNTKYFWHGFGIGFVYYVYIFSWFWSLYPLTALGISSKLASFILIFFIFLLSVACMAFWWGLCAAFIARLLPRTSRIFTPFLIAALIVLTFYIQSLTFGIVWAGKGTLIGPHWTLGNPAYFFAAIPVIMRTTAIWGIYGLDFLLALLVAGGVLYLRNHTFKKSFLVSLISVLVIFGLGILCSRTEITPNPNLYVSIIQTEIPVKSSYGTSEIFSDLTIKSNLLKEAAKKSDVVIFPERAWFSQTLSQFLDLSAIQKYFKNLSPKSILVIDNNRVRTDSGDVLKSEVSLIDSQNGVVGSYDKKLLTPGGEYVPYIIKGLIGIYSRFQPLAFAQFVAGDLDNTVDYDGQKIKILVCSDIISPSLSNSGTATYIVALNSMGLFGKNSSIANQYLRMAQFRAAENKKYLVLASNDGFSYIINRDGKIEGKTDLLGYQILTGRIAPNATVTWYNKLGDCPILLLSLALIISGTFFSKCQKRSGSLFSY